MKNTILALLILFFAPTLSINAENSTEKNNVFQIISKDDKKRAELESQYEQIGKLLKNRTFVIEADWLSDKYGNRVWVSSMINFISVDKPEAVIQVGSNQSLGYNGVGGVTAEGNINSLEIEKNDKKLSYYVKMSVMTTIGSYDVHMHVGANGNAEATVSGLSGGRLTYDGDLVALKESEIYKGHSTY